MLSGWVASAEQSEDPGRDVLGLSGLPARCIVRGITTCILEDAVGLVFVGPESRITIGPKIITLHHVIFQN